MSKYNVKHESVIQPTVTHENAKGLTQTPVNELIGILAVGTQKTFYEKETEREKRFKEVITEVAKKDPVFAAKALIYARTVFGQRSVTHYGAVELIPFLQGNELGKRFFSKRQRDKNAGGIIYRLDDMTEILAVYQSKNGVDASIPNSIKKGFRDAIEHADAYQLAKYQMKNHGVSLVDIINLAHPKASKTNGTVKIALNDFKKALKGTKYEKEYDFSVLKEDEKVIEIPSLRALVLGLLKQFNTVEDKNTESGKVIADRVKSDKITKEQAVVELNEAKTDNYKELIETKKIGYLALLRNVRNIIKTDNRDLLVKACKLLVQPDFIKKSLVWPHQIDLALELMLIEFSGKNLTLVAEALGTAYELSIPNLRNLLPEGKTAIVFDTSGSMIGGPVRVDQKTTVNKTPADKAALIAATFAKGVDGEVYHFANDTEQINGWNPTDSVNTLKKKFQSYNGRQGHGTNFGSCFNYFLRNKQKYDRVIIISDEQDGGGQVESAFKGYCNEYDMPYVYIINIAGYANTVPIKSGSRVHRLYGYSADIYEKIPKLELNVNEVIKAINAIEI